jgi:hypothetical protein
MTSFISRIGTIFALLMGHPLQADVAQTLQSAMIWSPDALARKQAYVAFRKSFDLAQKPASALLHLFADSRYLLWVNGKHVLRGPCRFNPKRPEFDTLDIAPHLRAGANTLVVLVHHYPATNGRIMKHAPGLTAVLEAVGREIFRTDKSWRCSSDTEYRPSPGAWSSIPDVIDGRLSPGNWTAHGFDDSSWKPSTPVDGNTWGKMHARSIPLPVATDLTGIQLKPDGKPFMDLLPIELRKTQSFVIGLGRMAMAYPTIVLDADEGSVLQLQYALRYVNGKPAETYGVGTTYTARAGRQSFIAADQWCARYVKVTCLAGGVKILSFKMTDRRYPFERVGSFQSSDPFLNLLWEMSVNTIECTSDDAYGSDARERNEWVQDAAKASFSTTRVATAGPGENGTKVYSDPRLLRNALRHAALSQIKDGSLLGTFPTDRGRSDPHYVIEDYNCQWVEALRSYHEATGDKAFIREMWPHLVKQMDWFLKRVTPRGLLLAREYTSFDNPLAYITCEGANINSFFYQALRDSEVLARLLQKNQQEQTYAKAADALHAAFNQHLWDSREGAYHAGFLKDELLSPTAHAQLIALQCGLVPENRKTSTRKWFLAHYKNPGAFHCGSNPDSARMIADKAGIEMPVMFYWVFNELYRMDTPTADAKALDEMRRRWKYMVELQQDAGTLSEKFVFADGSGASESCHNYGAMPAYFLSSYVLGVRRDGPVWEKKLLIEPRLSDLISAEGIVATEFGPVPVSWKRENGVLHASFQIPEGIQAAVRIPMPAHKLTSILAGGKPLWRNGKSIGQIPGITPVGEADGYVRFTIAPGTWEFEAR